MIASYTTATNVYTDILSSAYAGDTDDAFYTDHKDAIALRYQTYLTSKHTYH